MINERNLLYVQSTVICLQMKWRMDGNLGPSHRTMLLSNGALAYPTTIYYTAIYRSIIMFIVDYIIG